MKSRSKKKPIHKTQAIKIPDCRNFTGYKPCHPGSTCNQTCEDPKPFGRKILIVNLDAMGAVLQTTAMLPAIKRKYPVSHISWITLKNSYPLLLNNPFIDALYVWEAESWLYLQQVEFDIVYSVDKSKKACAFCSSIHSKEKLGFGLNKNGIIVPLNREAQYAYRLGLDDALKFKINQKYGTQIIQEALKLQFKRDEYVLVLTDEEKDFCADYKKQRGLASKDVVIGYNTGCSHLYPNKKMTIEQHVAIVERLSEIGGFKQVLVGGAEDTERNAEIARRAGEKVLNTPTKEGVRRGLCYENICDLIITGDSFGMHAAIALRKHVIAWFGMSCWSEIDLYDRGVKLYPENLECAPCWKKECPFELECIQMVDLDRIVEEVVQYGKGKIAPKS